MSVRRLALLVVYVLPDDDTEWLLQLHLDQIARTTTVPYRIYAAAPRVSPAAWDLLAARPEVEIHPTPAFDQIGSREHAHHLDALMHRALSDGDASHLATFDLDSFPIAGGWHDRLLDGVSAPGVAAVLRRENLDTVLPHPSCIVLPRDFATAHPFSFSPDTDGSRDFREFLRASGQRADTGIRLAYLLEREGVSWRRLLRSNRREIHPVIAGIYDDTVFHLGGGTRDTRFRRDLASSRSYRITRPIERIPAPRPSLKRAKTVVLDSLRAPADRAIVGRNRHAAVRARRCLREDPDAFFSYLRGHGTAPSGLADPPPPAVTRSAARPRAGDRP